MQNEGSMCNGVDVHSLFTKIPIVYCNLNDSSNSVI